MLASVFAAILALVPPPGPGGMPPPQMQQPMTPLPMSTPMAMPSPSATQRPPALTDARATALAKQWLRRLQTANIDRSQLSSSMNAALTPATADNIHKQYGRLGAPKSFTFTGKRSLSNGDTEYDYRVVFKQATITEKLIVNAAGEIDGISLNPGR